MIDPIELRKAIRRVLSAAKPDQTLSEGYILACLARFFPESTRADEMQTALAWNEARGWVDRRRNADEERDEWLLSTSGRIKEGLR